MATVTSFTAERMLEVEGSSIVDGEIRVDGHLWLIQRDGSEVDAGPVIGPVGPVGPVGPASISAIPGEVKLWPGSTLPLQTTYGKWVWADGAVYAVATYPIASGHINSAWKTFAGASDPGGSNFRVPDLRGLAPVGMDAMPGGTRANRMTRAVAITLAGRTGEETHIVTIPEMPVHNHIIQRDIHSLTPGSVPYSLIGGPVVDFSTNNAGGGAAHENVQPSVFVPYIVKLDD